MRHDADAHQRDQEENEMDATTVAVDSRVPAPRGQSARSGFRRLGWRVALTRRVGALSTQLTCRKNEAAIVLGCLGETL